MCKYFGGKIRIGKEISKRINEIELEIIGKNNGEYFEPFMGMAGVFRHMIGSNGRECIGCDAHEDLMIMWSSIQKGWVPPTHISMDLHKVLKTEPPSAIRAFAGFGCSYMGRFFSGFSDSSRQSYNQIMSFSEKIMSNRVRFLDHSDYTKHSPVNMTIYCDPPYIESGKSNNLVSQFNCFDHSVFWETIRTWSKNNIVFISETRSPADFVCIWEKRVGRNFYKKTGFHGEKNDRCERLFCHESYGVTPWESSPI